jgi:Zn-dependent oligopeptidase
MNTVAERINPASVPLNPLVDFSGLPRFDELKPEHIAPAIDEL